MPAEGYGGPAAEYLFDSTSDLGRRHMDHLARLLDPTTERCLEQTGVGEGWRCLDLGAGGGSVARWLAGRAGSGGRVVAVDRDTDQLAVPPEVEVHRHDLAAGLPDAGPFDLIHARLLLLHLPCRRELLAELVAALAPGGWLVLGEYSGRRNRVLAAPAAGDEALFDRLQDIAHHVVAADHGVCWTWAHEAAGAMSAAGLAGVRAEEHSWTTAGGGEGCLLHRNTMQQAWRQMLAAGATEGELRRYCDLMLDPGFSAWFYQFVCTSGQRPAAG